MLLEKNTKRLGQTILLHPIQTNPPSLQNIAGSPRASTHNANEKVDDHKMILNLPLFIKRHTVKHIHKLNSLYIQAHFLLHLTHHSILHVLTQLHQPTWNTPLAQTRLSTTPNKQKTTILQNAGTRAHNRTSRILPAQPLPHPRNRRYLRLSTYLRRPASH